MRVNGLLAVTVLAIGLCGTALAQDAPPPGASGMGRSGGMAFNGVGGEITAIEGSTITLHTFRGTTEKVLVTPSTRFSKDGNETKLSDFKVGDRVFAVGEQNKDGVWSAQILGQRSGGFQRGGMMGGTPLKPEDNGKTYIAGELLKIDGTKLTVKKPDNTEQIIEVDDDTSFRNGRDSVTLADMKPGDFVRGQGAVRDGVFVPKVLNAGKPRGIRPGGAGMVAPAGVVPSPDAAPQNQNPPAPVTGDEKK